MITKEDACEWYKKGAEDFISEQDAHHITKDDVVNQFDAFYSDRFTETSITPELLHPLMQYFSYKHLPTHLQDVSKPLADLTYELTIKLPMNIETEAFIRKMLEAKDCAVRAKLYKTPEFLTNIL